MREFTGRTAELKYLKQHYKKKGNGLLVVYGGRGVGKTRLLQEFCRDKKWGYYLARACSGTEQRFQWAAELNEKGLRTDACPSYRQLLGKAVAEKETEKQVLVIDEFHHLVKAGDDFFERLLDFLDDRLMSRPVMVILCTSASGWVENSMVSRLGNRTTAINGFLKLKGLPFEDIRTLFPEYSMENALRTYAVLGGIPGYWMSFDPGKDIRENLIENVLRKESRLYGEMSLFLDQELREPAVYNTILTAMASNSNKLNDIYRHTGFSRAKISVYLKNLMELDLVEKVYSFETEGRENTQKGIYRISNPYVRFYYRYLFPNQSLLQLVSPEEFYERKIAPSFDAFAEEAYRKICSEKMEAEFKNVGEWLGKTGNLDIVAAGETGGVCVAACSFCTVMRLADLEWLLFAMKKAKLSDADIRLYSEKGFAEDLKQEADRRGIQLLHLM